MEVNRDAAEATKANLLRFVYLFVFALAALKRREVIHYFKSQPNVVLLITWLFLTAFYSIDPVKVITNTIITIVGFTCAILFATAHAQQRRYYSLYVVVFIPMLLLNVISALIFLNQGVGYIEFLSSGQRYGGVAGNPNSLGLLAVVGYWAAACLVLSAHVGRSLRILAIAGIALFLLHIMLSGSGTSLLTAILITVALSWLRILSAFNIRIRRVLNISVMILFVLLLVLVGVASSPTEVYLAFTESLGKDASLTGRTELWAIAREAIAVHPIIGWGYDSHGSVFDTGTFAVPFNHYHNGFMDTIIAGGFILLAIMIYNLNLYMRAFLQAFQRDAQAFPMILPFILLLFLNLSEYSLLRPNSQNWTVYVLSFVMLTYREKELAPARAASGGRGRAEGTGQRRRGRRGMRWA